MVKIQRNNSYTEEEVHIQVRAHLSVHFYEASLAAKLENLITYKNMFLNLKNGLSIRYILRTLIFFFLWVMTTSYLANGLLFPQHSSAMDTTS